MISSRTARQYRLPRRAALGMAVAVALGVTGCGGPDLRLAADTAGTVLYEQGQQALLDEDWSKAVSAFDTLLRNYPTSPHLADARLGLGRAYYEQGRLDTLLLAVDSFQNFLTYHPANQHGDYAQLMIGLSYASMMSSPDRDQSNTLYARDAFQAFLEDYPDSPHVPIAQENLQRATDNLAEHELRVAKFLLGRGQYEAGRERCHYAIRNYPRSSLQCELIYTLAEAHRQEGEQERANSYYERVLAEHPQCEFAADARKRLNRGGATGSSK